MQRERAVAHKTNRALTNQPGKKSAEGPVTVKNPVYVAYIFPAEQAGSPDGVLRAAPPEQQGSACFASPPPPMNDIAVTLSSIGRVPAVGGRGAIAPFKTD